MNNKNNKLLRYLRDDIPIEFNEMLVLKKHFSRILNIFQGNILPPYEILIHPSSICNLNCKWCIGGVVSAKNNKNLLLENKLSSLDNMKILVEGILKYEKEGTNFLTGKKEKFSIENVSFSGITGEPFYSTEAILYAIDELCKHGKKVGVFTNGTLIKESMFDTILKMKYILISLDAGNRDTYDEIKCQGVKTNYFDQLVTNIIKLAERKKELNSKTDINIGYVINKYNYNQIYKVAKILNEAGVHYLRFKTDIASILNLTFEERAEAKKQIEQAKSDFCNSYFSIVEIHNVMDSSKKERKFNKCFIHYLVSNVSANLHMYPCNYHPSPKNRSYGQINKPDDFKILWDNIFENKLDSNIPKVCPEVCDPFKNRANRMLEVANDIYNEYGADYLFECINEAISKIK